MATYILLDPNEIVQQQQAMAVVAANNNANNTHLLNNPMPNLSMPSKSSSSNDVSSIEHHFLFHPLRRLFHYLLTDRNDFYLDCIRVCVCVYVRARACMHTLIICLFS